MTNTDAYNLLDDQWHSLDESMDDLIAACTTRQQGEALIQSWQQANANVLAARSKIFTTDDAEITALFSRVQETQQDINTSLEDLQAFVGQIDKLNAFIQNVSHAVALATSLVALLP